MHFLNWIEFYITNACNLNCTNCNRFNNFAFTGHQTWSDYQDVYRAWSKIINFGRISILGGEPMSNPDLPNWINGISELWPGTEITIITNGTFLNKIPNFYKLLEKYNGKVSLLITSHNPSNLLQDTKNIENFFPIQPTKTIYSNREEWKTRYNQSRAPAWPDCEHPDDFYNLPEQIQNECIIQHVIHPQQLFISKYTDGIITARFYSNVYFYSSSVIHNIETGVLTLHNSDPNIAMNVCAFKTCPHFIKGKLYKCGPTGLLPEFIDQFQVNISNQDRELVNSYQPAMANWSNEKLLSFLNNQKNAEPIAQCKFCPEKLETGMPLQASNKKIKFTKNLIKEKKTNNSPIT